LVLIRGVAEVLAFFVDEHDSTIKRKKNAEILRLILYLFGMFVRKKM